jgi:hypothetical protein
MEMCFDPTDGTGAPEADTIPPEYAMSASVHNADRRFAGVLAKNSWRAPSRRTLPHRSRSVIGPVLSLNDFTGQPSCCRIVR